MFVSCLPSPLSNPFTYSSLESSVLWNVCMPSRGVRLTTSRNFACSHLLVVAKNIPLHTYCLPCSSCIPEQCPHFGWHCYDHDKYVFIDHCSVRGAETSSFGWLKRTVLHSPKASWRTGLPTETSWLTILLLRLSRQKPLTTALIDGQNTFHPAWFTWWWCRLSGIEGACSFHFRSYNCFISFWS
jgi:hypothetical protein